jgi:sn-glycerol 3-phosphate transport system ATP-binding protein
VFLFDEPLSNLDAKLRVQMRLEIKKLQRDLGVTALYVTHDQVEAMTLADRMIVMNDGVADQIGAPLEVYANPQTEFVAGFIGSPPTNFIASDAIGAPAGMKIGIRPEHVAIVPAGEGTTTGLVQYAEPLGAETLVHLTIGGGQAVTVRQDGAVAIPIEGQQVDLFWDKADEMRFDSAGRRL